MSQKELVSPVLDIRLFGPLRVFVGGEEVTQRLSKRAAMLLGILALRVGRPIERWRLAGMLWPESPDATALHNLRQTLSPLRNVLAAGEQHLRSVSPRSLVLDKAAPVCVDVWQFDKAIKEGSSSSLQDAIDLYVAPLLAECAEHFAIPEREARSASFLSACDQVGTQLLADRQYAAAIEIFQKALKEDSFRESTCRSMMSALAGSGQVSAALDFCREFRNRLRRELNSDISQETRRLIRTIRATTAEKTSTSPARCLPVSLSRLIGRQAEIQQVAGMLTRSRLVTLVGVGGVGKTRLSIAAAMAADKHFKDGVYFVDLAPLHDATSLLTTIASAVEIPEKASFGIRDSIVEEIGDQEMLLILDNCEQLEPQLSETVEYLLARCSRLHILSTSRQSLGVAGEFVFTVRTLCAPDVAKREKEKPDEKDRARVLLSSEALRLFLERSHLKAESLSLSELETAGSICRTLDGLPLAIELAAARTRMLSLHEIESKLSDRFALLTGSTRTAARHRTLQASMEWSWEMLNPDERMILMRLSVYRGGATLETVRAVGSELSQSRLIDIIYSLVDRSLVNANKSIVETRYTLLETIRQYAEQKLIETGELNEVSDLHRDYFLAEADAASLLTGTEEEAREFERFEREHDNFRKAVSWCRERGDSEKRLRLVIRLSRFCTTQGHLTENLEQIEGALIEAPPDTAQDLVASVGILAGWTATVQKDCDRAVGHFERSLSIFQVQNNGAGIAKALICMGCAYVAGRRYDEAQEAFEASLANIISRGRIGGVPMLLANMAEVALLRNRNDEARSRLEEAFKGTYPTSEDAYETWGEAYLHLAVVDYRQSRFEEARSHAHEALGLLNAGKRLIDIPGVLQLIAVTSSPFEDWIGVATLLGASESLAEAYGSTLRDTLAEAHRDVSSAAQSALGSAAYEEAYRSGQGMDLNEAVEFAANRHIALHSKQDLEIEAG